VGETNYEIRLFGKEQMQAWNDLFKATFTTGLPENLFQWKYFSNPFGDAILAGAFNNDELVAAGALMPELNYLNGRKKLLYKFTDLMVHSSHQKRGLANKIIAHLTKQATANGSELLYTLCSKIATKGFVKNNWVYKGAMLNYFKPRILLGLQFAFVRQQKLLAEKTIRIITEPLELQSYFTVQNPSQLFIVAKDYAFLRWRMSHPRFKYRVLLYEQDERVMGYLLLSHESVSNMYSVIDVDAINDDKKVIEALLCTAEYLAYKAAARAILVTAMPDSSMHKAIGNKLYFHNPYSRGPLKSELDFNICLLENDLPYRNQEKLFDISALNYDDV
jgi:hypothetical protein